jgi:hypothetical protein
MKVTLCDWHDPAMVVTATYSVTVTQLSSGNSDIAQMFPVDLCDEHMTELAEFIGTKVITVRKYS